MSRSAHSRLALVIVSALARADDSSRQAVAHKGKAATAFVQVKERT